MEQGSINLYMFHAGTNFAHEWLLSSGNSGFATSHIYDYDALLDEEGNPTAKYLAVKKMMAPTPEYPQLEPIYKESMR